MPKDVQKEITVFSDCTSFLVSCHTSDLQDGQSVADRDQDGVKPDAKARVMSNNCISPVCRFGSAFGAAALPRTGTLPKAISAPGLQTRLYTTVFV